MLQRVYRPTLANEGSVSYATMIIISCNRGIKASFSLISDMYVLTLSLERHISVARPQFYHNLSDRAKIAKKLQQVS